ncbi:MAG: response regulator [Kiritimatiellae bacterium]|nr:response regulator [Kiritimatiellia bacterium]
MGHVHAGRTPYPGDDKLIRSVLGENAGARPARAVLEQEKEFFLGLIQDFTNAFFVIDAQHRLLIWNRACENMTGVRAADLLGTDRHWEAFFESKRPCLADIVVDHGLKDIRRLFGDFKVEPLVPEGWRAEGWLRGVGGKDRYVLVDAIPVHAPDGRVIAAAETIRDITEQYLTSEALRGKDEQILELQRLEAVGRLAGGVAHSFNNLLTSILGYGRIVADSLGRQHPLAPDVDEILRSGERAAKLTRQLLAFSRKQVAQAEALSLNAVAVEMGRLLRGTLGGHIELRVEVEKDLWNVLADPVLIEQAIMNLAMNAREAMPAGGTLTLRTANIVFDEAYCAGHAEALPGRHVVLSVADTGCGMAADVREHAFEPFFTTHDKSQRLGLGLSTVYGIVKQSGGHVEIRSEPGAGTEFTMYFPASAEPVAVMLEQADDSLPGGSEAVLVVEDDDSVRGLLCRILRGLGYAVLEAADGEEALRIAGARSKPVDLLLTDVVMPRMGGQELARTLREREPALKVLFASGFTDSGLVNHGLLDSTDPIILKPYTRETVAIKVRHVLDEPSA